MPTPTLQEQLKQRNAEFAALAPADKRVTIARDVIAALDAQRLTARCNAYGRFLIKNYSEMSFDESEAVYASDAQTVLAEGKLECSACALGSLFVCAVERMNAINVLALQSTPATGMHRYLADVFSSEQLDLIEAAFEGQAYARSERFRYCDREEDSVLLQAAVSFVCESKARDFDFDADDCMRRIMSNIIANQGEFIP